MCPTTAQSEPDFDGGSRTGHEDRWKKDKNCSRRLRTLSALAFHGSLPPSPCRSSTRRHSGRRLTTPNYRTCMTGRTLPGCLPQQSDSKGAALARPYIDEGKIPADVRALVMKRDGEHCQGCGATEDLTIDHKITPWSLGGSSTDPANLQVLYRSCNSSKGTRPGVASAAEPRRTRRRRQAQTTANAS